MLKSSSAHISPQVSSALLATCLRLVVDCILTNMFIPYSTLYLQDALTQAESQVVNLNTRLEQQEAKTREAETKHKLSLEESEKYKAGFSTERTAWDKEKATLVQRAETTESSLKETAAELTGLKRHISQMTSAIFGK